MDPLSSENFPKFPPGWMDVQVADPANGAGKTNDRPLSPKLIYNAQGRNRGAEP